MMMSPAAAAKARPRKRVLVSSFDDVGDDADWQPQRRSSSSKKRRVEAGAVITGGKATKTGMVLARAQLTTSPSGVVAAQERQAALLGKGKYRKAEDLAGEGPVGPPTRCRSTKARPGRWSSFRRISDSGCARLSRPRRALPAAGCMRLC